MNEYSFIDFLKSLTESNLENEIIELLFLNIEEEDLLNKLLELLKEHM